MFDDIKTQCACGRRVADGHSTCFRCHIKGITFTFHGGVRPGRGNWNDSVVEWKNEHLGEVINDPKYQPKETSCWT